MKKLLLTLLIAFIAISVGWAQSSNFSYGFEAAPGPDDWDDNIMVASGTNGITAATGAFYGQLPGANFDFTRFGGYNSVFPCNGYKASIKIYLDVDGGWANDTRLDYSVASNGSDGGHLRDFVFSVGFYDDLVAPGTGNRFVASVSNNTPGWPANPARSPAVIATTSGWYTLEHSFEDNAGVLEVVMKIYDPASTEVASWTLSNPADLIPSVVGGNRYGWVVTNEFSILAIDDVTLTPNPGNLPTAFTDFEIFSTGTVNYQGPGCTTVTPAGYTIPSPYGSLWTVTDEWGTAPSPFDQEVQDDGGNMVWRVSNAVISSGFSNQPQSPSSAMVAGETTAALYNDRGPLHTAPAPPNPRESASTPFFHSGFRFKSATGAAQPGLFISVNPTPRQSSIRMSYVGIEDVGTGFDLNFIETTPGSLFPSTTIASNLSYTDWHQLDIYVEFVDGLGAGGIGNDIVTVVLDGNIIHTGTSWESFYDETPGSFPDAPYAVDALMFTLRGTAAPGAAGNGFYIDDVAYDNLMAPPPPDRVFVYSDNTLTTLLSSHFNIQDAVNAAVSGNAVVADAGTYDEVVTIDKPLSLLGPNATTSAVTGTRTAEARLLQRININGTTTQDVTISGFEFFEVPAPTTWTIYIQGNSDNFTFENNRFIDCEKDAIRSGISSNTANVTVRGNLIQGITAPLASGILMGGINGTSVISDNKIDLAIIGTPTGYAGIQTPNATGLTISGNEISNTTNQGLQLAGVCGDVVIENNTISNTNTSNGADKGAIRLYGTDFTGPITITGNVLTSSFNGIAVKNGEDITGQDIVIENNDLSGNSNASIYNGASDGALNTTCNWHGSDDPVTITAGITGDVTFEPFLTTGGNSVVSGPGFSPTGDCVGCAGGGLVTNTTTSETFCSIQAAIDAASDGDVIDVSAGDFSENLTISKALTLNGANAGIDPNTAARGAETRLLDGSIVLSGTNTIVIDGFEIYQTNDILDVVLMGGPTTATLQNTIVNRQGITAGVNVRAVTTSAGPGVKTIANNLFTGDASNGLFSSHTTWNSGMYINGGASTVAINDNVFENCRTALNIDDMSVGITLDGNTIGDCGTVIAFGGTVPTTGSFTLGANDYTPSGGTFMNLSNVDPSFRLDITAGSVAGTAFTAIPLADLFLIEATMYHRTRSGRNGLVYYVANNQYVSSAVNSNIQTAIDYAAVNDVINIQDGTYNQRLVVSQSLTLDGQSKAGTVLNGMGLAGTGSGITVTNNVTDVTIQDLTVQNYTGSGANTSAGIYAPANNNNLSISNVAIQDNTSAAGFYANGPIDNVSITNSMVANHGPGARGIVIWNGMKTNIAITGNMVTNNNCCGIELQDGAASAVNISNNTIDIGSGDNAIGLTGLDESVGANTINTNMITGGGRYGIEIKNPAGGVTVNGNNVSLTTQNTNFKDRGGIVVMRRGVLSPPNIVNADVPNGVTVTNNTVNGYVQSNAGSNSEGFGIVVEGTNHIVTGNTVENCDVGIIQQQNPSNYPGDANDADVSDQFFGRGNSPITCGNTISGNTFSGNGVDERNIGAGSGVITNTNTGESFCSIQNAIDAATANDVLEVSAGTYDENVVVNKALTLNGPNAGVACDSRVAEVILAPAAGTPVMIIADGVTLNGFEVTAPDAFNAINLNNTSNTTITHNNVHHIGTNITGVASQNIHAIINILGATSSSNVTISNNCIENLGTPTFSNQSLSAIGILQSTTTGVLTGLNITGNMINNLDVNTADWPTGKIAYGILINVGGGGSYLTTAGEVQNAVISNNEISNLSGFISTGIGLEGNTKDAIVENNAVSNLYGRKFSGDRPGGAYDLSGLKFENNRYVSTVTVQDNSFQVNTFTHDATAGLGYAISNYVPAGTAFSGGDGGTTGEATISCNWLGSDIFGDLADNASFTGNIFNKAGAVTNFVPYLVNDTDDDAGMVGFQPTPMSCIGGPVQVYDGNTFIAVYTEIQAAIDDVTTLSGHTVRIASGTYVENVDAVTLGKSLTFAPGASPGCVTIMGNFTLNAGDVLEIEIEGTTACTEHDQFTVTGTVDLGDATLTIPVGMYVPVAGETIKIIDGSSPISGIFASGNFVTDGSGNTYYINYADNDVVLSKCCEGLLDLGIFNYAATSPVGNKLQVFVRPTIDVVNGSYSAGIFTIRTLATGVTFTKLGSGLSPYDYNQVGAPVTDGGYTYYFFNYETVNFVDWTAGTEYLLLTLSYDCIGDAEFELTNDPFTLANNGGYYQELGADEAQGIFYQPSAISPTGVSIMADNNGTLCATADIELSSMTSDGTAPYTYAWSGPDSYTSTLENPAPFASTLASAGTYTVTVTDANGCTAMATTEVVVLDNAGCVHNVTQNDYYPTITEAIDATATVADDVLFVPAANWPENVVVTKPLTINGANAGTDCDGTRGAESVIDGGIGTAVTIASDGVTIDGFEIEGATGISSIGFTDGAILNNKVNATALGIGVSGVVTTATDGYAIERNCVTLDAQTVTPTDPTYGIALTFADGDQAVVLEDNNVTNAFYGYAMVGVTTSSRTTVRGGVYTDLMQGVAVFNTLDGLSFVRSIIGVEDLSMSSFTGDHPAIPAANFHSGIYVYTAGANAAAIVDVTIDNVIVSNTGKISANSAGIQFADFSTGAGNRLNAVVTNSEISNNLNRGLYVRGVNATASVNNNEILFNGADPLGTGGNDGFGIIVNSEAAIALNNNTITNPPSQVGSSPVTAMSIAVAPAGSITAFENSINGNGNVNGSLTANTYPIAQFTATCNWWTSDDIDVVDGLVDENVLFVPYLNDGTDTDGGARGFVPTGGSCVNPTAWYVNDNDLTDDVFTLGLGDDLNQGTKRRPFRTIGKAVTTVENNTSTGPDDNTIFVDAGSYDEQVVVPNTVGNLTLQGVGPCDAIGSALTTTLDFTGTVTGKPTLLDIAGDGTVIDGIQFNVDLTNLHSAIIASDPGLDNITVQNNCIDPYQSTPGTYLGGYGNRNAISINYGGNTNFRVATGGVDNILVDNNRVSATLVGSILGDGDDIAFRSAVSVDEGAGTYTRNVFQSINHDVLVRFNSNGDLVIGGSAADANTFNGGGVQYSDPNAAGGAVTISHNAFDGSSTEGSVLRLQNNYHDAAVTVSDNTLSNLRWGISLENFSNVTVADNEFSPLAGFNDFRHITVNTKSISSNSATIVQVQIDGIFTGNTFNAGAAGTGTAMAFYNHDSDDADLGMFTVGTAGSPNTFAPGFLYAVYLGDQIGPTNPAPPGFSEYGGSISSTLMACWDRDIDVQNNTFDIGSGAQLPPTMNNAERLLLEVILYHLPDNPCLGELIYFDPVLVEAKVFLQGPYDSLSGLMNDDLRIGGWIPLTEPFSSINSAHAGSFVEVNNFVTETIAAPVLAVTGDDAIVDWVWLELRDMTVSGTKVATRAALVQRDGDIVDLDGISAVEFPDTYVGEYYLLVRHRNHLGAMTADPVDFTTVMPIDFTVAAEPTFGMTLTSARRLVQTGIYGLWAGNTEPYPSVLDGFNVKYNGGSNDRLPILNAVGNMTPLNILSNTYQLEDVNMDGQVKYNGSRNDRVIILQNVGPSTPLDVITQEPNN